MPPDSNILREGTLDRLRWEIKQEARRGRQPDEIEQIVLGADPDISTAERELGLLLARAESTNEIRERYLEQAAESYD